MVERVHCEIVRGTDTFTAAIVRYGALDRMRKQAERYEVELLAFGFGQAELRLVLEGEQAAITAFVKALKIGTCKVVAHFGLLLVWSPVVRHTVHEDLGEAVAWAHRAPVDSGAPGPLGSPWSSHRDLMGYRLADFYDPSVLRGRVDPRVVHGLAGGKQLPRGWPPKRARPEPLALLLRVSAAVLGVLPADRRCFRLFVHLGRSRGWGTGQLAEALALTPRRVRQLASEPEDRLPLALYALADRRLCRVP